MKLKYVPRPGDILLYKATNTPYIVIKIFDNYSDEDFKMALQNGTPGAIKTGNNMRFVHSKELFKTYDPKDETVKLLYAKE